MLDKELERHTHLVWHPFEVPCITAGPLKGCSYGWNEAFPVLYSFILF